MFKNLTDFSFKRTGKEAFGFYIAYFLVGVVLGAIAGALAGFASSSYNNTYHSAFIAGQIVGVTYTLIIGFLVLAKRKLNGFGYILLVLLSTALAVVFGELAGLIIPSILTTRGNDKVFIEPR